MIMGTFFVRMAANATNVVVIIFALTVLKSNRPITEDMVDVEDMVGAVMAMLEEMLTVEDAHMAPVAISPVIAMVVTVNLWLIGNIFILLMIIQSIEEHHRCFGLGGYFMVAMLAAASYSRIGFSLYFAVPARRVRVQVELSSTWNQEQYTLAGTLLGLDTFEAVRIT